MAPFGSNSQRTSWPSSEGDARLAAVFRQIRAILNCSEADMARRLGTGVDVILSLEAGVVEGLPPWPETARIVERYADLGGVDPAPILSRLLNLQPLPVIPPPSVQPVAVEPPLPLPLYDVQSAPPAAARMLASGVAPVAPMVAAPTPRQNFVAGSAPALLEPSGSEPSGPAGPAPVGFAARPRLKGEPTTGRPKVAPAVDHEPVDDTAARARRRRRLRSTALALSPLLLVAVLVVGHALTPGAVYGIARQLPGPLAGAMRGALDVIAAQSSRQLDGLRWIDLDDPRHRKAQRLSAR